MPEHNLQSIAFPTLDETQIAELAGCTSATPKLYRDGQTLFAVGDRDFNFFIVKSGEIEIVDHSGDEPKTLTVHRKGQFTGDISHLTGNPSGGQRHRPGRLRGVRDFGGGSATGPEPVPGPQRHHSPGVHRPAAASA